MEGETPSSLMSQCARISLNMSMLLVIMIKCLQDNARKYENVKLR